MKSPAFASILVPLDGSASADAALRLALRLVAPDGEVVVAHVINRSVVVAECVGPYGGDPSPALDALEADEREIFEQAGTRARDAGIRLSAVTLDGPTSSAVASLARDRRVEAIAMGTHGRRGLARIVLGSTAAGVLHETALPTFVVHEEGAEAAVAPFRQIFVALDASPAARNAARTAVNLAAHDDGRIFFAHVAEGHGDDDAMRAFDDARAYASSAGVPSDAATVHGDSVDAILVSAETCHASLIAIGAHGRDGTLFGMGSLAEAIVRVSRVPVLVVPIPTAKGVQPRPVRGGAAGAR
jgi:nucleotide-binding universal stress UspA family protein